MKQSEVYSHFMAKKLGMEGEMKKEMTKADENGQKNVEIDEEAAQIAVDQMINNNAINLQNF